jgi:polynucleotide 5'-kinase involved in rRNA processing
MGRTPGRAQAAANRSAPRDPNEWGLGPAERRRLRDRDCRVVYVIGDSDTGKSTLVDALVAALAGRRRVAAVDLDGGQATLGLPCTFGWRRCTDHRYPGPADGLYFTGTTSPTGHLPIIIAGSACMVDAARRAARMVVVDTCGLAAGTAGAALHHATIDAVRPDAVIGICRRDELEPTLGPLERAGSPTVIRAAPPGAVRSRSRSVRRSYRARRFRDYFVDATEFELDLRRVGILRARTDPVGRIASLRDRTGRDVALAIVRRHSEAAGTLTVLTPHAGPRGISSVVLGALRIARDGRQLARNV